MHMLGWRDHSWVCLTVRVSGCAQADDESVNETVDEEGEEEEQWALKVDADTAVEPPEEPPSRGASEGGVVSFGEVSFGGADSELRVEEGQTRASDDPFAETPAPRTLKDLVESKPFVAAGAKGGGSVGGSSRSAALQLSPSCRAERCIALRPLPECGPGDVSALTADCATPPPQGTLTISTPSLRPTLTPWWYDFPSHIPLEFGS